MEKGETSCAAQWESMCFNIREPEPSSEKSKKKQNFLDSRYKEKKYFHTFTCFK